MEHYRRRLQVEARASRAPAEGDWREALGDFRRVADWVALFDRELSMEPWRQVLDRWVQRLAPGLVAAATHGIIRTGHAVRSLGLGETPARIHELAEGLAYWAARYQRLPGTAAGDRRSILLPSHAIGTVETLPDAQRATTGLIADRLERLDGFEPFTPVINQVEVSREPSWFLSDLTETFASLYMTNANAEVLRSSTRSPDRARSG